MTSMLKTLAADDGATKIRIDFGDDAYVTTDLSDELGWNVWDNRRRYPQQVGTQLSWAEASRLAKSLRSTQARRAK